EPHRTRGCPGMTAVAEGAAEWPRSVAPARPASMPLFPTLWPSMMRGAASAAGLPFPLTDPGRREFSFARYGIYAIARALGLEGREVLFPAFFHCVELDALLAAGAKIALYPIGADLQLDPQAIADRIGPRTAALYVIHYAGFPAPIRALRTLCGGRGAGRRAAHGQGRLCRNGCRLRPHGDAGLRPGPGRHHHERVVAADLDAPGLCHDRRAAPPQLSLSARTAGRCRAADRRGVAGRGMPAVLPLPGRAAGRRAGATPGAVGPARGVLARAAPDDARWRVSGGQRAARNGALAAVPPGHDPRGARMAG